MSIATALPDRRPLGRQARALATLGAPLVGSHLAQVALVSTDTLMMGWYDVTALAGLSLGGPFFFVMFILGSGFALAVMPMVAAAAGTASDAEVRRVTRMGLWLSTLYGVVATIPLLLAEPILLALGQVPEVAHQAGLYLSIAGWGLTLHVLTMVLKSYLAALERTRIVLVVTVAAAILNVPLNALLIFGHWGLPELGIRGAALSSVVVQALSVVALAAYARARTPRYEIFRNLHRPDWPAFLRVFRVGLPIGLTSLAETGLFTATSLLMGWVGTVALAAHGIALQIASITFMVHVGLSSAVTVRVGQARGRGDRDGMRDAALAGLLLSGAVVLMTMAAFLSMPDTLVGAFVDPDDPRRSEILAAGATFLALGAAFQFFDAGQAMALGMLRGVEDTGVPMVLAGVAYWGIGLPAAWALGFPAGLGGAGIWLGLTTGLAVAAVALNLRFWRRMPRRAGV